ncbi:MAG TPA: MFS transporter [Abditibacteriaceae bacterium]|jgi:predicted MFS family arabinose efflux permease
MQSRAIRASVLVAALGYFVDIYDILLFSIVRAASLADLGVAKDQITSEGITLFNWQMSGMLLGGILWGMLGDKRGRLSVLYGSILMYSLANIANGFVHSLPLYALFRFIAGVGLAGELGAGVTLVSEIMEKETRGYGTMIIATVGVIGGVVASFVGTEFSWRVAYIVGGAMGLVLLCLRIGVKESGMFHSVQQRDVSRGNFLNLFTRGATLLKYLNCILIGLPIWCVVAIFITLAPEIGKALGMAIVPTAGGAVMWCYIGLALGDFGSGYISQRLRSRKKTMMLFMTLTALLVLLCVMGRGMSSTMFYALCLGLGVSVGYWAVFVTNAAEQFGTDIRATVTTTVPNFVRGAVVPITLGFNALRQTSLGILGSAAVLTFGILALGMLALSRLDETFGKELDYIEGQV